jgi:Tfp pilus assembly protein PilF
MLIENADKQIADKSYSVIVQTDLGLAYVYAMRGKTDQARSIIDRLIAAESKMYVHPMYLAIIHGALGETDEAFEWLEKGITDRSEWMIYLQVEHMLRPLQNTEKFTNIVQRMDFMD